CGCRLGRSGPGCPGLARSASPRSAPQHLLELARAPALRRRGHLDVVLAHALDAPLRHPVPDHLEGPAGKPRFVGRAETVTELDRLPGSVLGQGDGNLFWVASCRGAWTR